jgi:outer membrane protein assembly factor BamB
LFLAGANGAGEYIVVTTQNDVFAFTEGTGALAWKHNLGGYLGKGNSVCGSPTNHGIVSTPGLDPVKRVLYVVGGMTDGHYEIHALNADTGMPITAPAGWPVNSSQFKAGSKTFNTTVQIQRSALSLVNGPRLEVTTARRTAKR